MSKVYNSLFDLKEFGIIALTSEACGVGMRILCDLDEKGVEIVGDWLGGNVKFTKGSNWNSGANYSVLLSTGSFQELAAFCLIRGGEDYAVVFKNGAVQGMSEDIITRYRNLEGWLQESVQRVYRKTGTAGTRNKHVFSGRTK